MATRSTISIVTERTKDGVGRTIYSHWDGYPSNNGRILLEHYKDAKKINSLINLGYISSLAENVRPKKEGVRRKWNGAKMEYDLIPTKEPHSFDKPHDGVVVAYMRDRKEKDLKAHPFKGKAPNKKLSEEYDYLFVESENKWYVRDNHKSRPRFVELTEKVCEKN
jgi:hypothetical protein